MVDRFIMTDPATVIRLMTGLMALVYLALTVVSKRTGLLKAVVPAVAVVAVWALLPQAHKPWLRRK